MFKAVLIFFVLLIFKIAGADAQVSRNHIEDNFHVSITTIDHQWSKVTVVNGDRVEIKKVRTSRFNDLDSANSIAEEFSDEIFE